MAVVYAKNTCGVSRPGGAVVNLRRGQAWDADADLVREYPHLFEVEPEKVQGRAGVERATRAPGERRTLTRPKKAAD